MLETVDRECRLKAKAQALILHLQDDDSLWHLLDPELADWAREYDPRPPKLPVRHAVSRDPSWYVGTPSTHSED